MIKNSTGFTHRLDKGFDIGTLEEAEVVLTSVDTPKEDEKIDVWCDKTEKDTVVNAVTTVSKRQHKVREMFQNNLSLPELEKEKFCRFLMDHHTVFSLEDNERGETNLVQLEIDTGDAQPRRQHPRRLPYVAKQEVARQLKTMQEAGIIQPSISPWASPVVLVRKKDGTYRFCVDYRELNAVTKPDTFPLPRIDDLLDQLGNTKFFSTLDLASGFWQVQVHPNSRAKTAFVTPQGLYEFRVMPFGLTNAPAVFQRLMQRVLMDLNQKNDTDFVTVYIDDILVYSKTLEQHLDHLKVVMDRLIQTGLKLKPSKCLFVRKEVSYLGHVITPKGLKASDQHVTAVRDFPAPSNVKEVRQFLGLSSFYRKFIPSFAKLAQPLHSLTKKNAYFKWTEDCQQAFKLLKRKLSEAPVLVYPNFSKGFTVETDASYSGLGAILSQEQEDGCLHPVSYASRALSPAEQNYGITDLETLAVVWAVTHFRHYLYNQHVRIYTDHAAVKSVLQNPNISGKHARWWTKIYGSGLKEVKIVNRAGKESSNADALSRNPYGAAPTEGIGESEIQVSKVECDVDEVPVLLELEPYSSTSNTNLETLATEQQKDHRVAEILTYLKTGALPKEEQRACKIAAQANLFGMDNSVLYYIDPKRKSRKRTVVPHHLKERLIKSVHGGPLAGHFSNNRLYNLLVRSWWWDGMYVDVAKHCRNCPQCAFASGTGSVGRPPLQPIPVQRPFQIIGVDIMDLPKTERGNKHVLVFQDFLTKWPMVYPVPDQKTKRIVQILVEELIPLFGVPEALLSDKGTNLLSYLMKDVCSLLGIEKLNTTAYHPQCNGLTERFNRTLKTMLRKQAATHGLQWDKYLYGVLWAYRNTPHESTLEKPSFLLFGMDCRQPTEAAFMPPTPTGSLIMCDYRQELVKVLTSARQCAVKTIQKAQKKYKAQYGMIGHVQ